MENYIIDNKFQMDDECSLQNNVDYVDLPRSLAQYPVLEQACLIANDVKDKVFALGVPGLIIYNVGKFAVVSSAVFVATDLSMEANLTASISAGVGAVVFGQTGWVLAGMLGRKAYKRVIG